MEPRVDFFCQSYDYKHPACNQLESHQSSLLNGWQLSSASVSHWVSGQGQKWIQWKTWHKTHIPKPAVSSINWNITKDSFLAGENNKQSVKSWLHYFHPRKEKGLKMVEDCTCCGAYHLLTVLTHLHACMWIWFTSQAFLALLECIRLLITGWWLADTPSSPDWRGSRQKMPSPEKISADFCVAWHDFGRFKSHQSCRAINTGCIGPG